MSVNGSDRDDKLLKSAAADSSSNAFVILHKKANTTDLRPRAFKHKSTILSYMPVAVFVLSAAAIAYGFFPSL